MITTVTSQLQTYVFGMNVMPTKSELEQELIAVKAENERLKERIEAEDYYDEEFDEFEDCDDEKFDWIFPAILGVFAGILLS